MNRVTGFFCSASVVALLRYVASAACCRCVAFRSATPPETVLATVRIRRADWLEEAVEKVYKHHGGNKKEKERITLGAEYRDRYHSFSIEASNPPFPYFIGVWDTVRALGIPGSSGLVFWRHAFHNATLHARVPYARQAL